MDFSNENARAIAKLSATASSITADTGGHNEAEPPLPPTPPPAATAISASRTIAGKCDPSSKRETLSFTQISFFESEVNTRRV